MNRRTFLAAASSAVASAAVAAPVPKPTPVYDLLLFEYATQPSRVVIDGRRLVRVRVADGEVGKPVEVVKVSEQFFAMQGAYRLHADHFLLSPKGAVIDLTAGKVVHEPKGAELLGADEGRVIYRTELPKDKAGVYAFDPEKGAATKLDDPGGWALPGERSPDRSRSVALDRTGELFVHIPGGDPTSLGRGYKIDFSPLASVGHLPPVLWLDDKRVLSQIGNGRLVAVDVTSGKREEVIEAPAKAGVISPPRLWWDADGNVLYECGEGVHRIDVKADKAAPHEWHQLGHGFEVAVVADPVEGHTFRHDGKEIGKGFGDVTGAVVAPGLLAYIAWPPRNPKEGRGRRLEEEETRVWTAAAGKWLTPKVSTDVLVGWVRA